MIEYYTQAVVQALEGLLTLFTHLAMPLAVLLGLGAVAVGLTVALQRESAWLKQTDWRRHKANLFGLLGAALVLIAGWTCLHTALAGAFGAARVLGRRTLLAAVPAALLPLTFLSPTHSGLLVLILTLATLGALSIALRTDPRPDSP